ncbi:hypothetical protein ElyMa_006603600 [Elysia marginata]|uniref:Uncharacterized protein n=1 Tax=Elysia marginata TaxID=1093978 RepID=A0AAV4IE09_9GAST|nr:hypothetical protein ElyMa_006603600 [Elysia marginata]
MRICLATNRMLVGHRRWREWDKDRREGGERGVGEDNLDGFVITIAVFIMTLNGLDLIIERYDHDDNDDDEYDHDNNNSDYKDGDDDINNDDEDGGDNDDDEDEDEEDD